MKSEYAERATKFDLIVRMSETLDVARKRGTWGPETTMLYQRRANLIKTLRPQIVARNGE